MSMSDLYLMFFVVGAVLFAIIVVYSLLQQRKPKRDDSLDLFDDLDSMSDQAIDKSSIDNRSIDKKPGQSPINQTAEASTIHNKPTANQVSAQVSGDSNDSSNGQATQVDSVPTSQAPRGAITRAKSAFSNIKKAAQGNSARAAEPAVEDSQQVASSETIKSEPQLDDASSGSEEPPQIKVKITGDSNKVITDLVAKVRNPNPVEQSDLLSLFREHDFKFQRKVNIYGLNELTDMWRDVEFELPSARFLELGISIQLCDREGAMNQKELHDFQQMILEFSERYDAPFEFSADLDEALTQAQALDQVGRRYDSMAVLNVVPKSKSGFRMADIQSCARDLMMSSDKNGIFMKTEGQKNNITVLYRLACTDGAGHFGIQVTSQALATPVHDLVVYMNVPATREPEMVFQQMVKDANDLATWLDGKVVDRNGRAMTQRTYSTLMQQISDIAYSMQQEGLVPGDAVAKKLF